MTILHGYNSVHEYFAESDALNNESRKKYQETYKILADRVSGILEEKFDETNPGKGIEVKFFSDDSRMAVTEMLAGAEVMRWKINKTGFSTYEFSRDK